MIDTSKCEKYKADVEALAEMNEALRSVHKSDLDSPNVLGHIEEMGKLAAALYTWQRHTATQVPDRVLRCGEIWCCGDGEAEPKPEAVATPPVTS